MERDPKISKLFRESGLEHAPGNFTNQVVDKIQIEPVKKTYKPLISRTGSFLILLLIIAIAAVSVIYSEPSSKLLENVGMLSNFEWQLPRINFSFDFLSGFSFSTWLVSTIVALFLLVLADAGLGRKRLV